MNLCVDSDTDGKIVLKNKDGNIVTLMFENEDNLQTEKVILDNLMSSYERRVEEKTKNM